MVLRTRGLVRAEAGKWDDALADFDKAIAADPQAGFELPDQGRGAGQDETGAEALAVLEKGHSLAPDNIDLLLAKGQILITQSNYKAAAEELTRALAIDGSNLPVLELRAALYEQLGEKAKALADVEKILQIKPGQANIMRMRAALLADLGKYDAAVEVLQDLHKADPKDTLTMLQLGVLYTKMKQFDKAVEELQDLHKANPKDSLTMLQMGMLYTNMKKYDKAIEVFTAILKDHPDDVDAMSGRADALLNLGRRANAVSDYERALKLRPHDFGMLNNFAWLLATAPEDNLRDGHRALALATDACRQTEYKQDYILSTLAAAYAETGDFDSARKWAAQAVEVKPGENAEPSRKDELKKELQSYQANKPWREALPLAEEKKPSAAEKKDLAAEKKDPPKSDTPKKKKKSKKPAPTPDDTDTAQYARKDQRAVRQAFQPDKQVGLGHM